MDVEYRILVISCGNWLVLSVFVCSSVVLWRFFDFFGVVCGFGVYVVGVMLLDGLVSFVIVVLKVEIIRVV